MILRILYLNGDVLITQGRIQAIYGTALSYVSNGEPYATFGVRRVWQGRI